MMKNVARIFLLIALAFLAGKVLFSDLQETKSENSSLTMSID